MPQTAPSTFHVNVFADPFTCTWEEVAAALEQLPRIIFELDGSFVLSGGLGRERWQVDGHLYDFDGKLHRMELHGHCPVEVWEHLLCCVGWPAAPLKFEMVREGLLLNEKDFRLHMYPASVQD